MRTPQLFVGKTILVPTARLGRDVLADILAGRGAEVRRFPKLRGDLLSDVDGLEAALRSVDDFDWVLFAGELAVSGFARGLERLSGGPSSIKRPKLGTVGVGAARALGSLGYHVDYRPREHTPTAIAEGMAPLDGARVLLLRGDQAPRGLPEELEARGAVLREVAVFHVTVEIEAEPLRQALAAPLDLVAFANPSAVRLFTRTLTELGVERERCLAAIPLASVGPLTTQVATDRGLTPDVAAAGHLADLVRALERLWSP